MAPSRGERYSGRRGIGEGPRAARDDDGEPGADTGTGTGTGTGVGAPREHAATDSSTPSLRARRTSASHDFGAKERLEDMEIDETMREVDLKIPYF